ncbi:MAG: sensor histidine kinase [Chloroflexota bacterium]
MTPLLSPNSKRPLWRPLLPIRVRLTLWYVALLALILMAFSTFLYLSLADSLRHEMDTSLTAAAAQLQANLDLENGQVRLGDNLDQLRPSAVVALYDPTGQRLLGGTPPWSAWDLAGVRDGAAHGQAGFISVRALNGEGWRVLVAPVRENGRTVALLEIGRGENELQGTLRQLLLLMGLAVPATLAVATGGGLFLAQRALSPIDRITRLAKRIGAEDLSQRLGMPSSGDEVGRLAETFDGMLERLDSAFQRQRQFTADASHELRTPLAVVASQVDVALERQRSVAEYQESLRVVGGAAERMRQLVSELLILARADSARGAMEREPLSLAELAGEVVEQLQPLAETRGLRLELGRVEPVVVKGDQTRLMQLLFNLADNALKYTPAGGRVTVTVERRDGKAALAVADTGIGIAAEHLPYLFERFYRVDKARSRSEGGAGLGLAICDWIARAHGGSIEVASASGQGSIFTVYLPMTAEPQERRSSTSSLSK